jgi:16S rRNA (cytidine1402-2'-O)-methyltransferase
MMATSPAMPVFGRTHSTTRVKHTPMLPVEKKSLSLDYPLLAREFLQASGEAATCKLPAGLYIVATPIGHLGDITLRALVTLANADHVACEDTRVSGGMLTKYGFKRPLLSYHDHNAETAGAKILDRLKAGDSVALISDAGMPLISDPGFRLVGACQELGYPVTVIPGANAALTALAGSGLPTDQFHFAGFLPSKTAARQKAIAAIAAVPGTLLFYEAPQRLADSLADLAKILGDKRPAAVARELTKMFEETRRGSLSELAAFYTEQDVKGEIVILVAPTAEAVSHSAADIASMLKEALTTQSLRDAVNAVSVVAGAKKSEVYALALQLTGKDKS